MDTGTAEARHTCCTSCSACTEHPWIEGTCLCRANPLHTAFSAHNVSALLHVNLLDCLCCMTEVVLQRCIAMTSAHPTVVLLQISRMSSCGVDTAGNVIQVSLPQIKCHSEVQASLTRVSDLCLCLSEAQHLCTDTCLCNAISQAHGGSILYHNNIYYFYGGEQGRAYLAAWHVSLLFPSHPISVVPDITLTKLRPHPIAQLPFRLLPVSCCVCARHKSGYSYGCTCLTCQSSATQSNVRSAQKP